MKLHKGWDIQKTHRKKKIAVCGGAGFIGSEFIRQIVNRNYKPIVIDKLTYAGNLKRLKQVKSNYKFYKVDICNKRKLDKIFKKENFDIMINFAAATHVDNSIKDAIPFIQTNIHGVLNLLDVCLKYRIKRAVFLSTDEVYGEIKKGAFTENSPLNPNNPYSASKAAGDLLIKSYIKTHKLPAIIIRPCNNFGYYQHPEKLIPKIITNALNNKNIPIYGKGLQKREWLFVSDCIEGILLILEKGKIGEIYNLGSGIEKKNIEVAKEVLKILNKSEKLIEFVKDRPGHDYRYFLNCSKIKKLGYKPKVKFKEGIQKILCQK